MNTTKHNTSDPEMHVAVLIGRIVDGEATDDDLSQFAELADATPALWRELARQQRDAAMLSQTLSQQYSVSDRPRAMPKPSRSAWAVSGAVSGWAAVLVLAVLWIVVANNSPTEGNEAERVQPVLRDATPQVAATPDEQFRAYLNAPFVLGELDPIALQVDELPDGRIAVRLIRRVEEVLYLDAADDLPLDEFGQFTTDPEQLRKPSEHDRAAPDS
jgi:anti-sigma factor RsiW